MSIKSKLTLGPLYYHWPAEKHRDFYFRIADEAPIDEVYLGEVICSKRESFFEPYKQAVIERLQKAGKKIILSSLAMINTKRERKEWEEKVDDFQKIKMGSLDEQQAAWIEVNDVAAIQILKKYPFIIGPYITILNEGALGYLVTQGAKRIVFSSEMNGKAMAALAAQFPHLETEAQVFGRQPLAIAMRCYSARAQGRDKDHCRFACADSMDGLAVETLDGTSVWQVNGTQTLSAGTLVLTEEMLDMQAVGITHFRLSPQDIDMTRVSNLYRAFLEGRIASESLLNVLKEMDKTLYPINGFYHGEEGRNFIFDSK